MSRAVYFYDESHAVTVEVYDKTINDLLTTEIHSQLTPTEFLPQNIFHQRHLTTHPLRALPFLSAHLLPDDNMTRLFPLFHKAPSSLMSHHYVA